MMQTDILAKQLPIGGIIFSSAGPEGLAVAVQLLGINGGRAQNSRNPSRSASVLHGSAPSRSGFFLDQQNAPVKPRPSRLKLPVDWQFWIAPLWPRIQQPVTRYRVFGLPSRFRQKRRLAVAWFHLLQTCSATSLSL